jgi:hypothetical protein
MLAKSHRVPLSSPARQTESDCAEYDCALAGFAAMKTLAKARNAISATGRIVRLHASVLEGDENSRLDNRAAGVGRFWDA